MKSKSVRLNRRKATARRAKRVGKTAAKVVKRARARVKPARGRQSAEAMLSELKRRLMEISDLNFAGAVLSWDQATYMPPAGAPAR